MGKITQRAKGSYILSGQTPEIAIERAKPTMASCMREPTKEETNQE